VFAFLYEFATTLLFDFLFSGHRCTSYARTCITEKSDLPWLYPMY
jgi:hypothetical protein